MGLADKLIAKIEQQAVALVGYQQLDDKRQTRICGLESALLAAKAERDKALGDVQHWRQARQEAIEAGELMKAEIETLRQQLAEAHAPAMAQQSEEIAYLRARLDEERSVSASLRQQLAEAQQQDVDAMRADGERLRKFFEKVRRILPSDNFMSHKLLVIEAALAELDAKPAPVAETAEGGT